MNKPTFLPKSFLVLLVFIGWSSLTSAQSISDFSPKEIIGGMGQKLTITGSGFGSSQGSNYVSFYQESGSYMGSSDASALKYLTWSDTKIEMEMPCAFSDKIKVVVGGNEVSSSATLRVMACVQTRQVNPRAYTLVSGLSNGSYVWHMHQTYWDTPDVKEAIEDIFREFRCKTGVNFVLASEPSSANLTLDDDINLISPKDVELPGYNSRRWSSCGGIYSNKTQDIELSSQQDYYYGKGKAPDGKVKFRYVLMHELGHALGLGHVNEEGQTMYPSVTLLPSDNWSERDAITDEEKQAMSFYVGESQNFTENAGCNMFPLKPAANCDNVYDATTGVKEIASHTVTVYPNPVTGRNLNITSEKKYSQVNVLNSLGVLVLENNLAKTKDTKLDISRFSNGVYLFQFKLENGISVVKRVLIQH